MVSCKRRPPLRLLVLGLSMGCIGALNQTSAVSRGTVATSATQDTQAPASRHVDISSGSIAHAIAAVVVRARRGDSERAAAKRRLENGSVGTYINDILLERDSALTRWSGRAGHPLAVWIQPEADIRNFTTAYVDRVRSAFVEWDDLRLPVQFTFVSDSAKADVHVNWIDHFDQPISGRTRWARDDNWSITDANIVLAVHHHQGELLDEASMRAMAMHEIGHLLGLDHTSDTTSIMAAKVRVRELSDADRATARLLYSLPTGPLR